MWGVKLNGNKTDDHSNYRTFITLYLVGERIKFSIHSLEKVFNLVISRSLDQIEIKL